MTADLPFRFVVNDERTTITIEREFAAARPLVWDCHTKRELLDRWFAPKPLATKTKSMDFRPGGHWHYAMVTPDGQSFWNRLDYLSIDPIDAYAALDGFSDEDGTVNAEMPRSRWDVSFADRGARTRVTTVVAYDSPDAVQKVLDMGLKDGMASTLERLDELLVTLTST